MLIFFWIIFFKATLQAAEIQTAFDIGTGKIKMQIARIDEKIETIHCDAEQIMSAQKPILNKEGMITEEGQKKITQTLQFFKKVSERYNSVKCYGVATELFRKAHNGKEVIQEISTQLGIEIKIISSTEEGILSFLTIVQERNLDPEKIVVLDMGSGSFQITCRHEGAFLVYSCPFGRLPAHKFLKEHSFEQFKTVLDPINPFIIKKIIDCQNIVIGVGAHPKVILKSQHAYNKKDLSKAIETSLEIGVDYTDLLLMETIFESFLISQVNYLPSRAGNTSGILVLQQQK